MLNYKNVFWKLENESGFTLIELLVVIAISGVIIAAASNFIVSGYNFFYELEERVEYQRDIRFLTKYITTNVRYDANEMAIKDDFQSAKANLASGEKLIGRENSAIKYKEYGSPAKTLINLPDSINNFYFGFESGSDPNYLVLFVNDREINIILNNCGDSDIIDDSTTSEPNSIVFKDDE